MRAVVLAGLLAACAGRVAAQILPQTAPAAPAAAPTDALGRDTPRGTITGFSVAVRRGDMDLAAQFLQPAGRSDADTENLARDLSELLDRYFTQTVVSLSASPSGTLTDGLPQDRERFVLAMGGRSVDIYLTRVNDRIAGPIWLVSSDSLARVPALQRSPQATLVERFMPERLIARSYFGISLAQWILWALSILVPLVVVSALARLAGVVAARGIGDAARRPLFRSWWKGVRAWLVIGVTLLAHLVLMRFLGFSLTFRYNYTRRALVIAVIVFATLFWRLVSSTSAHLRMFALRRGRSDTRSLILLAERIVKAVLVLVAVIVLLTLAGVDTSAALAGAGIAGVAVALGAQRSIENLIGGVSLLTDKVIAVGDFCQISGRVGWIEDITLRSVRLRTLEQTLLSVPAGALAQGSIENFATRAKTLAQTTLRLRYGTTAAQLQTVLESIRRIVAEHPQVEQETARVRLVDFGAQAIEIELFVYFTISNWDTFLEARESLLLRIAAAVEKSGSQFATPTEIRIREDEPAASRP